MGFQLNFGEDHFKGTDLSMPKDQLNILLAEDNPSNVELMRYIIRKLGHRLEVVHDGKQAVERCTSECFDLVLMDIQMPVMDGIEATRQIRLLSEYNNKHLKIVALTATSLRLNGEHCTALGMDYCLIKPYRVKEIEDYLSQISPLGAGLQ